MRRGARAVLLIFVGLLAAPRLGRAQPTGPAAAFKPCQADSADHAKARDALQSLEARVLSLRGSEPVAPLNKELRALLAQPCFRLSAEHPRSVEFASALSLRVFWESGGQRWLHSYLSTPFVTHLPPDVRPALSLGGAQGSLPPALLCALGDARCGAEAAGWLLRAEWALAEREQRRWRPSDEAPAADSPQRCQKAARDAGPGQAYFEWRRCLEAARPRVPALPLGSFRAPDRGIWVVRGRRGHYDFCDEVRAYDLATGTAWVAQSCAGLALQKDGAVSPERTDDGRRLRVRVGRVSLDNLREAALFAVLAPEVREAQVSAVSHALPPGLVPSWPQGIGFGVGQGGGSWGSSAQTRLSWVLQGEGGLRAEGTLTWPESAAAGDSYAVRLLQVAEASLIDGCAAAELPAELPRPASARSGVSRVDGEPVMLSLLQQSLESKLRAAAAAAIRCPR